MKAENETKQGLRKKLDKAHAELIRSRGRCVTCGTSRSITCGHLIHRAKWATRWDTEANGNCHPQCWNCNYHHEEDALLFTSWYIRQWGEQQYEMLLLRSNRNYTPTKQELIETLESIKEERNNDRRQEDHP